MAPPRNAYFRKVFEALASHGLLLESDATLPSVVSLVAGEPVQGSWWGHRRGHDIFATCQHLLGHPEALCAKLVSRKVTYVHRELWPSLLAVATSGEPWQYDGLDANARRLLERIEDEGSVQTDLRSERGKVLSRSVLALEVRLLVHTEILHTEKGTHAKHVESWSHWQARARKQGGLGGRPVPARAKGTFELLVDSLNERYRAKARLPWQSAAR